MRGLRSRRSFSRRRSHIYFELPAPRVRVVFLCRFSTLRISDTRTKRLNQIDVWNLWGHRI
jgi:hypothetical protein